MVSFFAVFLQTYVTSLPYASCLLRRTSLRTHKLCNSILFQVDTSVFKSCSRVFRCVSNPYFYSFYARSRLFGEPVKFVPSLRPYLRQCTYKNSKADKRIFVKCGFGEFYLKLLLNFSSCLNGPHITVTIRISALI